MASVFRVTFTHFVNGVKPHRNGFATTELVMFTIGCGYSLIPEPDGVQLALTF